MITRLLALFHRTRWLLLTLLLTTPILGSWGFRGLTLPALDHLAAARRVGRASQTLSHTSLWRDALSRAHVGYDLLAGAALRLLPGWHASVVWGLGAVSALTCVGLLYSITRREHGRSAAMLAGLLFCIHPLTAAHITTLSPTLPALALLLGTWALITRDGARWRHALGLWSVGALLLLTWSPMLGWAALALVIMQRRTATSSPATLPGTIAPARLSAPLLLSVVMVPVVATALHPGLWRAPLDGWWEMLRHGWLLSTAFAPPIEQGPRMAPWAGVTLAWAYHPAVLLGAAAVGVVTWWRRAGRGADFAMACMTALFLLALPWMLPYGDYGAVSTLTMLTAPLSIFAAVGIMQVARGVFALNDAMVDASRLHPALKRRMRTGFRATLLAILVLPVTLVTLAHLPSFFTWRTPWSAPARPATHVLLPFEDVARIARELPEPSAPLMAGRWAPVIEEMGRGGHAIPTLTQDPTHASAELVERLGAAPQADEGAPPVMVTIGHDAAPAFEVVPRTTQE